MLALNELCDCWMQATGSSGGSPPTMAGWWRPVSINRLPMAAHVPKMKYAKQPGVPDCDEFDRA